MSQMSRYIGNERGVVDKLWSVITQQVDTMTGFPT